LPDRKVFHGGLLDKRTPEPVGTHLIVVCNPFLTSLWLLK
jgi:hypothetical protein